MNILMPTEELRKYKREWQRKWRAKHRRPRNRVSPFEKKGHCTVCGMLLSSDYHVSCPWVTEHVPKCKRCIVGNSGKCLICNK